MCGSGTFTWCEVGRWSRVHRLMAASAHNARGGVLQQFEDDSPGGFDWRGNETLVIQRGLNLETLSVRSLKQ